MVTKQFDESLGTLKTELGTQLKAEIKAVAEQSISTLRENVISRLLEENQMLKERVARGIMHWSFTHSKSKTQMQQKYHIILN